MPWRPEQTPGPPPEPKPPSDDKGDVLKRRTPSYEAPSPTTTQYANVATVEKASQSTLPTDAVLYLAGLEDNQKDIARISKMLARQFDITPNYLFGDTDPKNYVDPITGERLNLRQAQRFTDNFAPVAIAGMLTEASAGTPADLRRLIVE